MISIIVGGKNSLEALTVPCISGIHKTVTVPFELIGVDDGSSDGTYGYMRRTCHKALRLNGIGCGAMRNKALPHAVGDYIMFLDNDTRPDKPGWVRQMIADCERGNVGIIGPVLSDEQHKNGLARSADGLIDTAMVAGACLMFPRSTFAKLGMLDPKFSRRGEDSDYCLRAILSGLRVVITPQVFLYHRGAGTYDWRKEKRQLESFRRKYRNVAHILPIP
jgi:GT2 family glycosyltransferase